MKSEIKNNFNQPTPVPAPEDLGTLNPSCEGQYIGKLHWVDRLSF